MTLAQPARAALATPRARAKVAIATLRANPRAALPQVLPWALLAALLLLALITVITQAHRYGITIDEPLQQVYGERLLAWYRSRGQDTSFLTAFPAYDHLRDYGSIFDTVVAAIQLRLPGVDPWLARHLLTGLTGWLGLIAIALCGYELGGAWVAFAAALGLWLYPRYYGAIYNNPKDIPATVSMLFVLWATLLLLRYWSRRVRALEVCVVLGLTLGIATAVRVTAISWYAILAVLLAGWWIAQGMRVWRKGLLAATLARQGLMAGLVGGVWLLTTMALWPYVLLNPFANLVEAAQVMAHYPWTGTVLFNGAHYEAARLPGSYPLVWLVIGSPPILSLAVALGVAMLVAEAAKTRRINAATATVALAFALPFAGLLALHPILYDSLRQFLFLIPPLILLAAYGIVRALQALWGWRAARWRGYARWAAAALLAVTLVGYALVVSEMVRLSPYEYTYFSPVVGGLRGASGTYETDYYATCATSAAEWLGRNYTRYTTNPAPTTDARDVLQPLVAPYLPTALHESPTHPDFFIGFTRYDDDLRYPTYRTIYAVAAEDVTLCVVKANPATTSGP